MATGIGEAAKSDSPVLVLPRSFTRGAAFQLAMDQDAFTTSLGADAHRVPTPETAVADVVRAIAPRCANDDRGAEPAAGCRPHRRWAASAG